MFRGYPNFELYFPEEQQRWLDYLAEEVAQQTTPRTFNLIQRDHQTREEGPRFFVFGCQGNKSQEQIDVANFMATLALHPDTKPAFVLILGDNFYDWGVGSPSDAAFEKRFDDIYGAFKKLGIPCFVILGNHDANIHRFSGPIETGISRELHQVAHSYLPDADYTSINAKEALYQQDTLVLETLPLWNMPARTYALVYANTQIMCIDSNTYVRDYLTYLTQGEATPAHNQAKWLASIYQLATSAHRQRILAMHHPLFTTGKRAYHADVNLYLDANERAAIQQHFPHLSDDDAYNSYLKACFVEQQLTFDLVLAAHDHNLCYYNNALLSSSTPAPNKTLVIPEYPTDIELQEIAPKQEKSYHLCQLISGGGGGGLQVRRRFSDQQAMGCFLDHHGFSIIDCRAQHIAISIRTVDKKFHLMFDHHSHAPLRHYPNAMCLAEKKAIEKLTECIYRGICGYFDFLDQAQQKKHGHYHSQNIKHGKKGNTRAHDVWAYLCHFEVDDYATTLKTLYEMTSKDNAWLPTYFKGPSTNSLITHINHAIAENYGKGETLESLYEKRNNTHLLLTHMASP